jgi:hypothetical protein
MAAAACASSEVCAQETSCSNEHCLSSLSFPQATPANWPNNHESIGAKGWAFILPTVTKEDADKVGACTQTAV